MGTNFDNDGVIPRAVDDVFDIGRKTEGDVQVVLSYMEIYNEEVKDLLSDNNKPLPVREGIDGEVTVPDLTHKPVSSAKEVADIMKVASAGRKTGRTDMNEGSSRSHAICTMTVTVEKGGEGGEAVAAKFTMVDLAGSERQKRTGATGERLREGISINKGLFVLGQVVSALSEGGSQHIPYRDSKLTRLLTTSLGGNSRTVMIACVSPADVNLEESCNTLRYAARARNIKNEAVKNVVGKGLGPAEAAKLKRENQMLKLQLLELQLQGGGATGTAVAAGDPSEAGGPPGVVDVERLGVVMKLRSENSALRETAKQAEVRAVRAAEEALEANMTSDRYRIRYEQVVAEAKGKGVSLAATLGGPGNDLVAELREQIEGLKRDRDRADADAAVAKATATAVVMGDGNMTAAMEIALRNAGEDEDEEEESESPASMASELNTISSKIAEKEELSSQLVKERESIETLKAHFQSAMRSLQEEVDVLSGERENLMEKLNHKEVSAPKLSLVQQQKLRTQINELEGKIKLLKNKSSEHRRALRMKETAESKCRELQVEIENDKKRRTALMRRMREETDARRNEKRAAELKGMRMARDADRLKVELNKVREAAAKQAAVLKRRAAEAVAKQRVTAEQRKRAAAASGSGPHGDAGEPGGRRADIATWLDRELEVSKMVRATKEQLNDQATKRAIATKKRDKLVGSKNSKEVSALDAEIETRTGVIVQLQRGLMELERENKATSNGFSSGGERFIGLNKGEFKFVCGEMFEKVVAVTVERDDLAKVRDQRDAQAIEDAREEERVRNVEEIKKIKMEHTEAMMSLLEATKGAVEHKVCVEVMEAASGNGGGVDDELKSTVDQMLGGFFEGMQKVGDQLFDELEDIKETEAREKEKAAEKLRKEKERKKFAKMKKVQWRPEDEMDEDDFDEPEDDGALQEDEDSDWEPGTPKAGKKSKRRSKKKAGGEENDMDTSIVQIENMLEDTDEVDPKEAEDAGDLSILSEDVLKKMKVAELKDALKARKLTVSGKKDVLVQRLLDFFKTLDGGESGAVIEIDQSHSEGDTEPESDLSMVSSGVGSSSPKTLDISMDTSFEESTRSSGGTPYAKKVVKKTVFLHRDSSGGASTAEQKESIKVKVKPDEDKVQSSAPVTTKPGFLMASKPVKPKVITSTQAHVPYWQNVQQQGPESAVNTSSNSDTSNGTSGSRGSSSSSGSADSKIVEERRRKLAEWKAKQKQNEGNGNKRPASFRQDNVPTTGPRAGPYSPAKRFKRDNSDKVRSVLNSITNMETNLEAVGIVNVQKKKVANPAATGAARPKFQF